MTAEGEANKDLYHFDGGKKITLHVPTSQQPRQDSVVDQLMTGDTMHDSTAEMIFAPQPAANSQAQEMTDIQQSDYRASVFASYDSRIERQRCIDIRTVAELREWSGNFSMPGTNSPDEKKSLPDIQRKRSTSDQRVKRGSMHILTATCNESLREPTADDKSTLCPFTLQGDSSEIEVDVRDPLLNLFLSMTLPLSPIEWTPEW